MAHCYPIGQEVSHRESPFPTNIFLVLLLLLLPPVCHFAALLSSLGLFENKQLEGMYSGPWELQCGGRRKSRRKANKVDVAKPESWQKKYFVWEIPDNCIWNFVSLSISQMWWKNSWWKMGPRVHCIHAPWKVCLLIHHLSRNQLWKLPWRHS